MTLELLSQPRTDEDLQRIVQEELRWDTHVEGARIGVSVTDGVVTLTGQARSYADKLAAQEAAHRVTGVHDVANDIQVTRPGPHVLTDTQLAQSVRRALTQDVFVPEEQISSSVTNGWVTLEGTVKTWNQLVDAVRAVRYIEGVIGLTNHIVIKAPAAPPETIRASIEQALERQAEREARRITVTVRDGVVTLEGTVRSYPEKMAAAATARHAPGIRQIENRLKVEPYV